MGKIVLTMQMSLDGVVSDVDQWMTLSDEILKDTVDYYESVGLVVVGGRTYASLAEYWQDAETSSASREERELAARLNTLPKAVVSRSRRELVWRNSRQILFRDKDAFVREMSELKTSTAGHISVESGAGTWRLFIGASLFDELWLFIHPVVVGRGDRLFEGAPGRLNLLLDNSKVYENGVVGLRYRKI